MIRLIYYDYFARLGKFGSTGILLRIALCKNWQWLPNQNKNGNDIASTWRLFHSYFSGFRGNCKDSLL